MRKSRLPAKDGGDLTIEVHVEGDRDAIKRAVSLEALNLLGWHLEGR